MMIRAATAAAATIAVTTTTTKIIIINRHNLHRYLSLWGRRWCKGGENFLITIFMNCATHKMLSGRSNQERWDE